MKEVAERLSVSVATVYRLAEVGELPHVRIRNAVRIRPEDVEAYLAQARR